MKKTSKIFIACILTLLIFVQLIGCAVKTPEGGSQYVSSEEPSPIKTSIGYRNEREKYFYGLSEPTLGSNDAGQTLDMTLDFIDAFNFKSYRLFMHHTQNLVIRNSNENEVTLRAEAVAYYKNYVSELNSRGITHIVAMSHYYAYPVGFNIAGDSSGVFPEPGSIYYDDFMNLVEKTYYLVAKTFPEIQYWEPGNENNANVNCKPANGGTYTLDQKVHIMTDLVFFANHGIKRASLETGTEVALVFPALMFDTSYNYQILGGANKDRHGIIPFTYSLYEKIFSGEFPSAELYENPTLKSTNTDDYFDVFCYHPYTFTGRTDFDSVYIQDNLAVYDILKEYGDDGKKVFFTEIGWSTGRSTFELKEVWEQEQGNYVKADYKNIWEFLPFVETIQTFRLFDWAGQIQAQGKFDHDYGYGLFTVAGTGLATDPGPRPKKVGLQLYWLINGDDAPLTALYKYYKTIDVYELRTTLKIGATMQFTLLWVPSDASTNTIVYESDDPTIASVSAGGLVTALKSGVVDIVIKTTDGKYKTSSRVTVS